MSIRTLTVMAALALAACIASPAHAAGRTLPAIPVTAPSVSPVLPAPTLAPPPLPVEPLPALVTADGAVADADDADVHRELVDLAMTLRHIRYVRGGHDPSTGFDCSGFVRYVFGQVVGLQLPRNAASQFLAGLKVKRSQLQPGDLVFFRTAGRHGRVSHVGIYIDNGQFIHSPSRGETVRVDNLASRYWARRFAGAKRLDAMAGVEMPDHHG